MPFWGVVHLDVTPCSSFPPHVSPISRHPTLPLRYRLPTFAIPILPLQVPWENQNMHCIVTVYGCAVHIDTANELES